MFVGCKRERNFIPKQADADSFLFALQGYMVDVEIRNLASPAVAVSVCGHCYSEFCGFLE